MDCNCFYCGSGKEHPERHKNWHRISDKLLKAESLDPKDSVAMEACQTCGHKREVRK